MSLTDKIKEAGGEGKEVAQKEVMDLAESTETAKTSIKEMLTNANANLHNTTGMVSSGEAEFVPFDRPVVEQEVILLPKPKEGVTFYSTNTSQPFATALPSGKLAKGPYTTTDKAEIEYLQQFVENDALPCTTSTEVMYEGMDEEEG